MTSRVYVKFPKAGLGNMLLTWSRGYIFSKLNDLELYTSSWTGINLGVWLRNERKKRLYIGYFRQKSVQQKIHFLIAKHGLKELYEPPVEKLEALPSDTLFVFNKIFIDYDFFKEVRPYRTVLHHALFDMLTPSLRHQFDEYERPLIGVHIRRGDFKRGSTITPVSFFVEVINKIRIEAKKKLPVTVFTDAELFEIKELLALDDIKIAEPKADILDLLLLASSKICVLSIGSTFSYWAAFLTDGYIIEHSNEWHVPFSSPSSDKEIVWDGQVKFKIG